MNYAGALDIITVFTKNHLYFIDKKDIVRIETESSVARKKGRIVRNGDGNFTHLYLKNGNDHMVCKQMIEWEILLKEEIFFRTHRSHLINLRYVDRLCEENGGELILKIEKQPRVPISNSQKAILKNLLSGL